MKRAKKQGNENVISTTPVGIQAFFKPVPNSTQNANTITNAKPDDNPKKFYVDVLKEKIRRARDGVQMVGDNNNNAKRYESDAVGISKEVLYDFEAELEGDNTKSSAKCDGCVQKSVERTELEEKYKQVSLEKAEWKEKYTKEMEQRKELKKVYLNLTVRFSELHSKYEDLFKVTTANRQSQVVGEATSSASSVDIYTTNEVKFLDCMPRNKKDDCSFILHCLKYAYKGDPTVLAAKTLYGTPEWTQITDDGEKIIHSGKTPVTPEKVSRIKGLFVDRISKCEIDSVDFGERIKDSYVNKLIAAGIRNLSKKRKQ